jgi:primosomal protein N' (replication factor Y)
VDECCPECGGVLKYEGIGTQKAEEELLELFPGTKVLRMDADSVSQAGGHDVLLSRFRREKIPILIGTQMVAKGLNFENVTLVGVLSADQSLYAGDFHAGERTFSLITQVVGRSGRGDKPGQAIIQTFTPGNQIITLASRQDYDGFYESELALRRLQESPPFCDLYTITASGLDESQVLRCAAFIRDELLCSLAGRTDVRILGPAPLPVLRVNNRYRYNVTLACRGDRAARAAVSAIVIRCSTDNAFRGVSVFADSEE